MDVSICCSKYRCTWKLGPITWDGSTAGEGYLEWTYLTPECAHKWRLHLLHTKVNLGTLPIIWVTKKREQGFGRISKVSMRWVPRKITACMPLLIQTSRNHRVAFFTTSSWVRGALGGREEPSGKPFTSGGRAKVTLILFLIRESIQSQVYQYQAILLSEQLYESLLGIEVILGFYFLLSKKIA